LSVLRQFTGLSHRAEKVRESNGVQWINDSKGTNVGATIAALQGLSQDITGKWILIAGGIAKNADFSLLKEVIPLYCRAVILIGEAAPELQLLLENSLLCIRAENMEDAVQKAKQEAKPGDGVLLSPACASFDMFKNFEERGNVFKSLVNALPPQQISH
jgi:UDP-N-acetylmuramoylalanine--D-glutamate ligase